ncbi:hypothetical protein ACPC36_31890 [Streptomyces pseudogriseolus]
MWTGVAVVLAGALCALAIPRPARRTAPDPAAPAQDRTSTPA